MLRRIIATIIVTLLSFTAVQAQETVFGKNKVRYKDFDWSYIRDKHFEVYFYEDAYPTAKFAAEVLESAYVEIKRELDYSITSPVPIFLYNSHNDFQQTNITFSFLSEGIGGFTEIFKNRIVIPHDGSYEDLRHVLHHELTHAVVNDLILGGSSFSKVLARGGFFDLPLWFSEGYAEYSSRHGWDYWSDMFVRDATINGYLTPPEYLFNFLAYKQGQAMIKFIADKYGEDKIGEILQKARLHRSIDKSMKASIGVNQQEFWEEFSREMKRRYWPEIARRKEADEIGKQFTRARKDGSYFNEKPVWSPDGRHIAYFTDKSEFTEIVLVNADNGRKVKGLVKANRSGDLESLHSYVSGMSFSPDGADIVFVAKSGGKESLFFLNVHDSEVFRKIKLDFYNIISPVWSPDGKKIAFSALEGHKRDLFVMDIDSEHVTKLTHDRYDDIEPSWTPDSKFLIFSSDRPHPQNPVIDHFGQPYVQSGALMPGDFEYGHYNLNRIDIDTRQISSVDVGPGQNKYPQVSPDGRKVAFISNRNGIDNIYIGNLDSTADYYAVTDILSGVTELSWSPDSDKLVFSSFQKGGFDIFVLDKITPAGDHGVLEPTDFVLGKYNLLSDGNETKDNDKEDEKVSDAVAAADDTVIDSTLIMDDTTTAESPALAALDSTDSSSETGVLSSTDTSGVDIVSEDSTDVLTGESQGEIIGDEYVHTGSDSADVLDSLMETIPPYRDDFGIKRDTSESTVFDSVPPRLPSGEYEINDYKVKLTTDYIGGNLGVGSRFGVGGTLGFLFSDYLGNHQLLIQANLVGSIDQSAFAGMYLNQIHRTTYGLQAFHYKDYYLDATSYNNNSQSWFSDRILGFGGFAWRPFSTYSRLETSVLQTLISREYFNYSTFRPGRTIAVSSGKFGWVYDNVLWGYTGPVNGRRARIDIEAGVDFFNSNNVEFYSLQFDYRKYWHFARTFTMAFRMTGGLSEGATPKTYLLGGTTNWIGTRTIDAEILEPENLYFSEVVTPLRGLGFYELRGNRYGLVNWEFRFPMIQYFAMRYPLPLVLANINGAIFADMGTAWYDNKFKASFSANEGGFENIHTGFGIGLRLNLYIFLLRYDLAWTTDFDTVSPRAKSYFSVGADF